MVVITIWSNIRHEHTHRDTSCNTETKPSHIPDQNKTEYIRLYDSIYTLDSTAHAQVRYNRGYNNTQICSPLDHHDDATVLISLYICGCIALRYIDRLWWCCVHNVLPNLFQETNECRLAATLLPCHIR